MLDGLFVLFQLSNVEVIGLESAFKMIMQIEEAKTFDGKRKSVL